MRWSGKNRSDTTSFGNFDKEGICMIFSAIGEFEKCPARKFVPTLQDIIHVFHHGVHTCNGKNNAPYQGQ